MAVWLGLGLLLAGLFFLASSRTTTIASHDAEITPTLTGHAELQTGPVLPLLTELPAQLLPAIEQAAKELLARNG